jgi:type IV secretory pathway TrbL component
VQPLEAIKDFFCRVPNHLSLGFGFSAVMLMLMLFSIALGCVLFSFATIGQQDWLLYIIMGAFLVIVGFHFYLNWRYGLSKKSIEPYRRLLTNSYTSLSVTCLFKQSLKRI